MCHVCHYMTIVTIVRNDYRIFFGKDKAVNRVNKPDLGEKNGRL